MKNILLVQFAVFLLVAGMSGAALASTKDISKSKSCAGSVTQWYKGIQSAVKAQGHSLQGKTAVIRLDEGAMPAALNDDCIWVCCDEDSGLYTPGCDYFCKECD